MNRVAKAATITVALLAAVAPAALAASPSPDTHGTRVSAVARSAAYATGQARGAAVSLEARKQGELRRAEAKARAAARASAAPSKGPGASSGAAAEPGRLRGQSAAS